MSKQIFNHTIPKFILRGFCIPGTENVSVYVKGVGIISGGYNINSGNIDKFFGARGQYSSKPISEIAPHSENIIFDTNKNLEEALAKIESKVAPIISSYVVNGDKNIDQESINLLRIFAYLQFVRTPSFKDQHKQIINNYQDPNLRQKFRDDLLKNKQILNRLGLSEDKIKAIFNSEDNVKTILAKFSEDNSNPFMHEIDITNPTFLNTFVDNVIPHNIKLITSRSSNSLFLPDIGVLQPVFENNYTQDGYIDMFLSVSSSTGILFYENGTDFPSVLDDDIVLKLNELAYLDSLKVLFGPSHQELETFGTKYDNRKISQNGFLKRFME